MEPINVLQHLGALQEEIQQLREAQQEAQRELHTLRETTQQAQQAQQEAEQQLQLARAFLDQAGAPADPAEPGLAWRLAWVLGELAALRQVPARAIQPALPGRPPQPEAVHPSVQGNVFTWRHGEHTVRARPPGATGRGWSLESARGDRPYTLLRRCRSWDQLWTGLVGCCDQRGFTPGGRRLLRDAVHTGNRRRP